eukprot:g2962.t1
MSRDPTAPLPPQQAARPASPLATLSVLSWNIADWVPSAGELGLPAWALALGGSGAEDGLCSAAAPASWSAADNRAALHCALCRADADVIALQECSSPEWPFPAHGGAADGAGAVLRCAACGSVHAPLAHTHARTLSARSHSGWTHMLLRRTLLPRVRRIFDASSLRPSAPPAVGATVDVGGGARPQLLDVVSLHLAPGKQGKAARLAQVRAVAAALLPAQAQAGTRRHAPAALLVGDWNWRAAETSALRRVRLGGGGGGSAAAAGDVLREHPLGFMSWDSFVNQYHRGGYEFRCCFDRIFVRAGGRAGAAGTHANAAGASAAADADASAEGEPPVKIEFVQAIGHEPLHAGAGHSWYLSDHFGYLARKGDYAVSVEGIRDGRASLGADGVWRFETLKGRQCNDVCCLIIFLVFWLVSGLLTHHAFRNGDPARLVYATDYKGDVCGVGPEKANRYIYYPALHTSLIPIGKCLPSCPIKRQRVCVPVKAFGRTTEHCDILASNSSSFMYRCLRFTQYKKLLTVQCQAFGPNSAGPVPPPTPRRLQEGTDYTNCLHYLREWPRDAAVLGGNPCSLLGTFRKIKCGGKDADATNPSTKALCEVALLRAYPHCVEHQLELGTYTDESVNNHPIYIALTAGADSLMLLIGELQKAGSLLFIIGGLLSAFISVVWLLNVQRIGPKIVECIVKLALATLMFVLAVFAIIFFSLAGTIEVKQVNDVLGISHEEGDALLAIQDIKSSGARDEYEATGWFFIVCFVIAGVVISSMWEKIEIAIALIKTAAKTLRSMPLVPFFPIAATSAMALALVYWLVGISYIVSVPDPDSNNATSIIKRAMVTIQNSRNGTGEVQITRDEVNQWFDRNGTSFGSDLADRLHPEKFSHDLLHGNIVWDLEMKAFSVFWVTMVSKWYWYKEGQTREGHMFPIWGSFKRVIKYHMGSMALGAAILRISQLWLWALAYLTEQLRRIETGGGALKTVTKVIRLCLRCIVCCLKGVIEFLTSSAYVVIAIQGGSFCNATKDAFKLMRSQVRLGLMTEFAGGVLISLITLAIALICACVSYLILKFEHEIPNWFFPFFDVLQTAIDTIFICYCADVILNKKEGALARNMIAFEEIKQADAEAHGDDDEKRIRMQRARARARRAEENEAKGVVTASLDEGGAAKTGPSPEPIASQGKGGGDWSAVTLAPKTLKRGENKNKKKGNRMLI